MRITSSLTIAASLSLGAFACVPPNDDVDPGIRRALPTADDVKIELPENAQKATGDKGLGDVAAWYVVTRDITRDLNGGTAWVLILVHTIVQFPPTSVDGDTYTWGPWGADDALEPAIYQLVVSDLHNGSYGWSLDGDSKLDDAERFETVISGTAWSEEVEGAGGHGDFTIDFDAAERVNPIDNDGTGQVAIVYDIPARRLELSAVDGESSAEYSYEEAEDGSGNMTFSAHGDTEDDGTLPEDAVVRSRWLPTGDGRADVRLSGGDLGGNQVTASQCWDEHFGEVYYGDSAGFIPESGVEADCAYAQADLPPL
jgi:hypothetical protein